MLSAKIKLENANYLNNPQKAKIIQNLPTKQSQDCMNTTDKFQKSFIVDLTLMVFRKIQEI